MFCDCCEVVGVAVVVGGLEEGVRGRRSCARPEAFGRGPSG